MSSTKEGLGLVRELREGDRIVFAREGETFATIRVLEENRIAMKFPKDVRIDVEREG
jgi:hypothetical protein